MKQLIAIILMAAIAISCNNKSESHSNHDTTATGQTGGTETETVQQVRPVFASLDNAVSSHIKEVFDHYIHVKTALVNSNAEEAKSGANAILEVVKDFDKSLLTAEQKVAYDKSMGAIKASANNIAAASEIEKQREHFSQLSNQAYELAKSFGAGRTVYHEHCPMTFNDKGAMWLSESKEIKNPYFGEKMLECGTVEEAIEK
jgi:hypothetical protein